VPVPGPVHVVEPLFHVRCRVPVPQLDRQRVLLPAVAHVEAAGEPPVLVFHLLGEQRGVPLAGERVDDPRELAECAFIQGEQDRRRELVLQVGQQHAERREGRGHLRDDRGGDAHLPGQHRAEHRPGAAEREQRELP